MDIDEDQENPASLTPIDDSDDETKHCSASVNTPSDRKLRKGKRLPSLRIYSSRRLFHNFTDGIFFGNAWLFCERHVAYAVVAATLYHEFAQEFADFCLLTHH